MSRRSIPADVALKLRKEAGFGCCKCGRHVYQYHHIIEYAEDPHFRPEDMMILCPYCHDEATKRAMTVAEQRHHKANPFNFRQGRASGSLKVNTENCVVSAGSFARLVGQGDLIVVDGEPLLTLGVNESGCMELTLLLYDRDDNLLASIQQNEWISSQAASLWDIESDFQYLRIRQRKGDIRLEIDATKEPIQIRANLWRNGQNIKLGSNELVLQDQNCVFRDFTFTDTAIAVDSTTGGFSVRAIPRPAEGGEMINLLLHQDKTFVDQTVHLSGFAFSRCTFTSCTLVIREIGFHMSECKLIACSWHLDLLVYNVDVWKHLLERLSTLSESLPFATGGQAVDVTPQ